MKLLMMNIPLSLLIISFKIYRGYGSEDLYPSNEDTSDMNSELGTPVSPKLKAGPTFAGPLSNIWTDQCRFLKGHGEVSLEVCQQKCMEEPECTAINHAAPAIGCVTRACGYPVPDPTATTHPYKGYKIEKGPTFAGPLNKIWTDQCRFLKGHGEVSLQVCKQKCTEEPECTAINHAAPAIGCVTRACQVPVPDPTATTYPYKGYKIETGPSFVFAGPLNKIWTDQCRFLKGHGEVSLEVCQQKCMEEPECTAINHAAPAIGCVTRACGYPVPNPTATTHPYKGYKIEKVPPTTTTTTTTTATTTPPPTDCKAKKKCIKKSGTCIPEIESCSGKIIKKGCMTKGCNCCVSKAPIVCSQSVSATKKCTERGGVCQPKTDKCKGDFEKKLCKGKQCGCCIPN